MSRPLASGALETPRVLVAAGKRCGSMSGVAEVAEQLAGAFDEQQAVSPASPTTHKAALTIADAKAGLSVTFGVPPDCHLNHDQGLAGMRSSRILN
jgi:hypothetical protein